VTQFDLQDLLAKIGEKEMLLHRVTEQNKNLVEVVKQLQQQLTAPDTAKEK